ncbi:unnamed protein product [Paramecium sonneborni]|uniref:Uncharacterized protein n=1 Tax=Paramecium sonneborni TaxID=65129 RepID=A0A8S1K0N0_9CILI|nr:unnamed protein product [Paramecium sonneborni]
MENKAMRYFGMSLNVLISVFLALLEIYVNQVSDSIIIDVVLILCGTFFSWIFISQKLGWKMADISPFFFWALAIKRIILVGIQRNEFVFFLFGFLNGIYASKLEIKDKKRYYLKAKTAFEVLLIMVLTIFNFLTNTINNHIILIIFYIILFVLIGIFENVNTEIYPIALKQENCITDQRNTQAELKKCQTIIQQYQSTKSIWEQFNNLTDDWICQIDITKSTFNNDWEIQSQSFVLKKFLKENKTNLRQFFNHLQIVNQSQSISQSSLDENNTFLNWLEKNYLQKKWQNRLNFQKQKQFQNGQDSNQQFQEDQQSMISPQNDGRFMDQKDQILDCPAQSAALINMDTKESVHKTQIQCQLSLNSIKLNLNLIIYLVEDDRCNDHKQYSIIIHMKNIPKNEILDSQRLIFYRYAGRIADKSSQMLQQVTLMKKSLQLQLTQFDKIKQSNFGSLSYYDDNAFNKSIQIRDFKQAYLNIQKQSPRQNTNQKVTSTLSHNHDSLDENIQKLSISYFQQLQEIFKQIDKLNFDLIIMEQNNFNFFELFSNPQLDIEQFNILTSINIVKEFFQQNPFLNQHNIIITQELNNETQVIIQSDKRKIKQILINIINNSIEKFELNQKELQLSKNENSQIQQRQTIQKQDLKYQNTIVIKTQCDIDKIIIEISDQFGGIDQEQLNNRLNDCKFGLSASQKILRYLAYDPQKPLEIINYEKCSTGVKGTVVRFVLPKTRDNFQLLEESNHMESLTVKIIRDKS